MIIPGFMPPLANRLQSSGAFNGYQDDFSSDTSGEWVRGANSTNGTWVVTGGVLQYTRGSTDDTNPRIWRLVTGLTPSTSYSLSGTVAGTAASKFLRGVTGSFDSSTADDNAPKAIIASAAGEISIHLVILGGSTDDTVTLDNVLLTLT